MKVDVKAALRRADEAYRWGGAEVEALADDVRDLVQELRQTRHDLERALRTPGDPECGPDAEQSAGAYPIYEKYARLQDEHVKLRIRVRELSEAVQQYRLGMGDEVVHSLDRDPAYVEARDNLVLALGRALEMLK